MTSTSTILRTNKDKTSEMPSINLSSAANCSSTTHFARNCSNQLKDRVTAPTQNTCLYPLVPNNDEKSWFKDVEKCSLNCKHPISDFTQQAIIKLIIEVLSTIGLITTLVAILLFVLTEKYNKQHSRSSSHMAKVIKRCVVCHFIVYLGWSLQMFFGNIACSPNGASISGLTLTANACVLSFLLTYLPSLSNLLWCAYLARLCYEKISGFSKNQKSSSNEVDIILSRSSYVLPLILLMTVVLVIQIDGNGLYGVCTVGRQSTMMKILFVFIPKIVGTIYGNYYFMLTIYKFMKVSNMSPSKKRNLARIIALASLNTMDVLFSIWNYLNNFINQQEWNDSIHNYLDCKTNLKSLYDDSELIMVDKCIIDKKPTITLYYLELVSTLGIGIVIASWAFCGPNLKVLRSKLIELLVEDEIKPNKKDQFCDQNQDTYQNPIDCTSSTRTKNQDMELSDYFAENISMTNSDSLSRSISISIGTCRSKISKRGKQFFYNNPLTARDVVNDSRYNRGLRTQAEVHNQSLLVSLLTNFPDHPLIVDIEQIAMMILRTNVNSRPPNLNTNYEAPFVHSIVDSG